MRKMLMMLVVLSLTLTMVACGKDGSKAEIVLVSRENGSGTRGAFSEILGLEEKGADGSKKDLTSKEAIVVNKTDVMLTTVAEDKNAIGYLSLASLNEDVKALKINGVEPSAQTIQDGSYLLARPFNLAFREGASPLVEDFVAFILSKEGQEIAAGNYVPIDSEAASYQPSGLEGKVSVSGSSSVAPLMEKLREGYLLLNPQVILEVQMTDSTSGLSSAMEGRTDLAMASRDLNQEEGEALFSTVIALDGICMIVNSENPLEALSLDQAGAIYKGELSSWSELDGQD